MITEQTYQQVQVEEAPLKPRAAGGGFGPLLSKELQTWWGGRRWITQAILWQVIINGLLVMVLFVLPSVAPDGAGLDDDPVVNGLQGFFSIGAMALAVGVILLSGDAITGEVQSGTAEWLLTKPISRAAFVLSKLAAHTFGMLVVLIALPGVVAYALLSLAGELDAVRFALGPAALALHTFFYLTLTLMTGALTRNRAVVTGVALAVLLGGQLLVSLVAMLPIAPVVLLTPMLLPQIATALAGGSALPMQMIIPLAATTGWCMLFVIVALWGFERVEL